MKITIERKSFVDALAIGSQMAGKAKGLSILENCKITIKDNSAIISSYDSEVAITKRTSVVSSEGNVVFCIEPKSLIAILRSLRDENVDLVLDGNNICNIIHKKGRQSMPYESPDDFPSPVLDEETKSFPIDPQLLCLWLKEAKSFVGSNTLYPSMMGVYLYCGGNEYGVASTNTEVLYHNKTNIDMDCQEFGASVTIKAIDALIPMLCDGQDVNVMIGTRNIVFKSTDSMLVAARTEQPYPNFKRIIPSSHAISVEVDKNDLLDTIKRAMLTANEQTTLLKMSFSGLSAKIVSEDLMFSKKTHEECLCTCHGDDIEIGLKGTYAINMLNSIESDKVTIELNAPQRPVLWKDSLNDAKILMQMPCSV